MSAGGQVYVGFVYARKEKNRCNMTCLQKSKRFLLKASFHISAFRACALKRNNILLIAAHAQRGELSQKR